MKAALLLALAALPPARASAVDYEFSMPAGFHPDEAARALVGGDDAAESARLHASLDAPCKAALKKLACSCRRPFFSSPAADAPTLELDAVASMASVRSPRRRLHDHQRVDASRKKEPRRVFAMALCKTHKHHAGLSTHATCGATSQPCQATCDAVSSVCPAHVC